MNTIIIPGGVPEPMSALNKIKIVENHEPLVDIRETCTGFTYSDSVHKFPYRSHLKYADAKHSYPFLRQTVAEMLCEAQSRLPEDFHFFVIGALRTYESQSFLWHRYYDKVKKLHPDWPENILKKATNKYDAPIDQKAPPGHTTGGAVDVALQRADGSLVDVLPGDLEDWSMSHTWSTRVSDDVHHYRMILLETMLGVGFSNCRDEYWHYSYGDSAWAVRVGEKECCYGAVELPETSIV